MTEKYPAFDHADARISEPRNRKRFLGRIGGSVLIIALLLLFLPRDQFFDSLSRFSTGIWLSGSSIYLCLHLIGVAKWRMLINSAGAGLGFLQAAHCYYYGLFANTFLPSVVGGDIVRAGLAMRIGRSRSAVLMGSLVDRSIDSLSLVLMAGMAALLIPSALDDYSRQIFWAFALLIAAVVAIFLILVILLPARRFPFRLRRKLVRLRLAARLLAKRRGRMLTALISAIFLQTSQVVMNLWLGRLAMIQQATFLMWLFVWPLAKLAALVPLTQGGIGLREAAQGALFVPFGVSIEKAVATGFIFQAIVISGNLMGGALAALAGRFAPAGNAKTDQQPSGSVHQRGILGAILLGGALFLTANILAIAYGTGSVGSTWIDWMSALPGYGASFAGGCAGFVYGAVPGYLMGRLVRSNNGLSQEF